jgi:hypothetical protein
LDKWSQVSAGQAVGIKEVHGNIWLMSFYDLGCFDLGDFEPDRPASAL